MPAQARLVYEAGAWEIDAGRRELRVRGVAVPIGGRSFEIIEALVVSAGELVTKDELMRRVWPGGIVEENTLQVHISAIRKALGPDRGMLKTISGRGYRLLGPWTIRRASLAPERGPPEREPPERPRNGSHPWLTNVPVAAPALIGREPAVQHLLDVLSAYRVVTLTGPGGIGKSVLALEVAVRLFPGFQGDAWLVELVSLSDPGLLPSAVASVLGLQLGDQVSPEAVARAIGGKRLLLLLDNCEHVIDAAARMAETLVRLCPGITVLSTSREILRIAGEHVEHVRPLDVPSHHQEQAGDVLEHSAVQLFIARTRALGTDVAAQTENLPRIGAICRRLDGIPLALEFAAARAATLGVHQVAERLDDRFDLLTSGRRTALPRHHTLRATLDWSFHLLPEEERHLLRRLAVFPGGFTLEAATAVMGDVATSVAVGISNLVLKSLVSIDGSEIARRWRLLETIRAYALEKLAEAGETALAARRQAAFFRDLFAPVTPGWSFSMVGDAAQRSMDDMARCAREIGNVRAALDWAYSPGGEPAIGVVLTAAYAPVWLHLALLVECRERAERALLALDAGMAVTAPLRMQLHIALGLAGIMTIWSAGRARAVLATALELAENLDHPDAQQRILWGLWILNTYSGECRAALAIAEQLSQVAARSADAAAILMADRIIGNTLQYAGDQPTAERHFERVIRQWVEPRDGRRSYWIQLDQHMLARATLARSLLLQGRVEQAAAQARASLEEAQALHYDFSICEALRLAVFPAALLTGDLAAAEDAATMLIDIATSCNGTFWLIVGRCLKGKLLVHQGDYMAGTTLLRTEIDASEKSGWAIWHPEFLGALADGLAGLGQFAEALATIERALAKAEHGGERYYVAELWRSKGEFLLRDTARQYAADAEHCFQRALAVARQQGALFWELRAALSLARLRIGQARPHDARAIVAASYDRFTEGFETADLQSARDLLEALPGA